jgi:hypothetical protein
MTAVKPSIPVVILGCLITGVPFLNAQDSDTTPPELLAFDFHELGSDWSDKSIDVTVEPKQVQAMVTIRDVLSGVGLQRR